MQHPGQTTSITAGENESSPSGSGWKERVRVVPRNMPPGSPLFPFDGRDPHASEHYRIIRTKILSDLRRLRVLTITSPQVGDGKSVSAANITGSLALRDCTSVLLMDADFRRSALSSLLDLPASPGLAEVLAGQSSLEQAVVRVTSPAFDFYFLPAGRSQQNPAELFDTKGWARCCAEIRREFDFAVIDTPPIGVVADYELVQVVSDGVILIVRPDHTNRQQGLTALQSIPRDRLIGVIANCVPDWFMTRSLYHDYGYYEERNG